MGRGAGQAVYEIAGFNSFSWCCFNSFSWCYARKRMNQKGKGSNIYIYISRSCHWPKVTFWVWDLVSICQYAGHLGQSQVIFSTAEPVEYTSDQKPRGTPTVERQSLCVIWQVLNPWHFSGCFNSDTYDLRWSYKFSRLLHCLRSVLKLCPVWVFEPPHKWLICMFHSAW